MALVNQPAILSGAFAAEGDKNTIPANNDGLSGLASIAKGFPPITQVPLAQGGQPPQRQDFNGIFNLFSQFLLFAQNGGVYAYNNTLDYQPPCIISYDGEFYSCVTENGPSTSAGVQPVTNTTYWEKLVPDIAVMQGASGSAAGASGLVPAPAQNQQKNFLTGAGVWQAIATTEQAQAGTDDSAPMTALKVKQAINALTNAIPVGTILPFAGGTIPSGFLACNGATVSRTTYSALFSAIGTTYGSGDGSTTFNLPLIEDNRFLEFASTAGTKKNAGLPNITGYASFPIRSDNTNVAVRGWGGAFSADSNYARFFNINPIADSTEETNRLVFNASGSSSVYGNSTTVQPKSLTVRAIIKY